MTDGSNIIYRMALEPLADAFSDLILADQDCFRSDDGWEELLKLIPDVAIASNLRKKWFSDKDRSSEDKWKDLKTAVRDSAPPGSTQRVCFHAGPRHANLFTSVQ